MGLSHQCGDRAVHGLRAEDRRKHSPRPSANVKVPPVPELPRFRKSHSSEFLQISSDCSFVSTGDAYCFSSFSIAEVTSGESGVTAGSKRCTTLPLRSTRNLVKFHLMSPV